jgi:hypothetical protein
MFYMCIIKESRWFATMDITAICLGIKGNNKARVNSALYGGHFGVKNEGIGPENTYYWNVYDE